MAMPVCTFCGDTGKVFDGVGQIERVCRHCRKGCPQEGDLTEGNEALHLSGDCHNGVVSDSRQSHGQETW